MADYIQMKELYEAAQGKIRDMYELEEKVKTFNARAETLNEECNMLKSKIVVL